MNPWKRNSLLLACLIVLAIALMLITGHAGEASSGPGIVPATGDASGAPGGPGVLAEMKPVVYLSMGLILVIVVGGIVYMMVLQWRFMNVCREENQLALYTQSPAGLPSGTVRAMIAILTVTVSLFLAVLYFFQLAGTESRYPEVLSSLLGAVIGFYFGSRAGGGQTNDEGLQTEIKDLKTQRDRVVTEKDAAQTESLLGKINKGIALSRTVSLLLPKELREKYDQVIGKLEQGVTVIENLQKSGDVKSALEQSQGLFNLFKTENPVRDIYSQALGSFATVLGSAVPALAVISTVVQVGAKLVGVAYEKWRTRVLGAPFFPSVTPLQVADANTGFLLLRLSPIFKKAFLNELETNDRAFMQSALNLLQRDDVEPFWEAHKGNFESRAEFEDGVMEFRQAAADMELDPALFAEAGGKEIFLQSLDRINQDEKARAALQQLAVVVETMQQEGQPVLSIFDKVRKEVAP
jgi:hypothetical protein